MRFVRRDATVPEVDMTPMIDIVFQLLTFFMMVINFEQTQADERVKLPRDELAKPAEVKREKELVLNVGFDRNTQGEKLSDAMVFYAGDEVPVLAMKDKLETEQRLYLGAGTKPEDVHIVIRADAEVPTGLIQELIKQAQEADFVKFSLKAMQAEQAVQ